MKARVIVPFVDRETGKYNAVDSEITVSESRFLELSAKGRIETVSDAVDSIEGMSLEELKEYAKGHDIKLNGARTKAAIIEAINAAQ